MEDKIIGIVGTEKGINDTWTLKSVYVKPEHRGQGIGTALLEAIIWKLDHLHHARIIELKVNTRQEVAINLYKKCGFTVVDTLENQESGDGNLYTKFIMYRNACAIHPTYALKEDFFIFKF